MNTVRSIASQYENMGPTMSQELREFLDIVWSNRVEILCNDYSWGTSSRSKLYQLYTQLDNQAPDATPENVLPFLRKLLPLSQHPMARPIKLQAGPSTGMDVEGMLSRLENPRYPDRDNIAVECGNGFYHAPGEAAGMADRIYLNVAPAFSIDVLSFVIRDLRGMHRDTLKAKLSGPYRQGADGIVIWVTSLRRSDGILRALADYQQNHSAFFRDGVPRLAKPIPKVDGKDLRGVALATQPPEGQSFGKSRIIPIFDALYELVDADPTLFDKFKTQETEGRQKYDAAKKLFVKRAVEKLSDAGISATNVHL